MVTISLCMIVRDEEDVLARCLSSVDGLVDEIIVVDTGSVDRTRDIALEYGAKVYDYIWVDNFAAARNAAFDKATMDYILWLDADDVIDDENRAAFLTLKETLEQDTDVVMMRYHVAFDEAGQPTYTFFRERLLRRVMNFRWGGRVHEAITPMGKVTRSQVAIRHEKLKAGEPGRNLRIYERMLQEGEALEPRHRYYYARELFSNGRDDEAIVMLHQCIDDPATWVENRIGACRDLSSCYLRKGNEVEAMEALLKSFTLGEPRAETCCDIGAIFLRQQRYRDAAFWYRVAPQCTPSEEQGGFAMPECRGYIPYMQLCVCYDHLGQYDLAEACNEQAAHLKQNDKAAEMNREYFQARRARIAGEEERKGALSP